LTNRVDQAVAITGAAIVAISIPFIVNKELVPIGVISAVSGIALIISSFMWSRARAEGRFDSNDRPIVHTECWAQWPISQEDRRYVAGDDSPTATEICFGPHGPEWAGESPVRLGHGKLMVVKSNSIPFSERSVIRFEYEVRRYGGMGVQTNTPLDIIFAVASIIRLIWPEIWISEIRVPIPIGREVEAEELVKRYNALMRG
jgi:hypothetical protein